ncbi:MAG TPA: endonuclease V [Gemmataceae bacterium]|jgi:deoxyribonuclease V|nr:endonuclease V [Gemmataceae bacterium]
MVANRLESEFVLPALKIQDAGIIMIAFVDVDYREVGAVAAAVLASAWTDAVPTAEFTTFVPSVADYVPGEFYRRELPCIEAILNRCPAVPNVVIIDGYVWLGPDRPGLGAKLHEALGFRTPVVGVAKTAFKSAASIAIEVHRSASRQPLWVTAIGTDPTTAAEAIRTMHGSYRIPSLIRRVDQVARTALSE